MKRTDFAYELPDELIARFPSDVRSHSRMLHLDRATGQIADCRFDQLTQLLRPSDLLVFNDTKVIPARLFGHKPTGGAVEVLVERVLKDNRALAHVRASKSPKVGSTLLLADNQIRVEVSARHEDLFELRFPADKPTLVYLEEFGHIPLPGYMDRKDEAIDRDRYQTVYARNPGAVAAPTAGLRFDGPLLADLACMGVGSAYVTLHVGAGTFRPVRTENVQDHTMHSEWVNVPAETIEKIAEARAQGGRVIAVGTTVVRSLESSALPGRFGAFEGDTNIFIYPGFNFRIVDGLITNFHLPESTLLMLVCAFAGYDQVMAAYRHAVESRYRFYSYGDAMFLI